MKKYALTAALALFTSMSFAAPKTTNKDIAAQFPQATEGQVRWMIDLPKKNQEDLLQLEIIASKTMEIDCNKHTLMGDFKEESLQGFGYPYYTFSGSGDTVATRMACMDATAKKTVVAAPGKIIRYNSKLPTIIYAPKGIDIGYRVWSAPEKTKAATAQ
jgi:ecotin